MAFSLRVVIGIILCCLLVTMPIGIALLRNSPRMVSVVLWNTLGLAFFGLGWIIAFFISITDGSGSSNHTTVIIQNAVSQHNGPKESA